MKTRCAAAILLISWLPAAPLLAQTATAGSIGLPSERTAYTLSLTTTLASWGLLLASSATPGGASGIGVAAIPGIMVGPSLGSFYGGLWARGLILSGLRVGVSALVLTYVLNNDEKDNTAMAVLMVGTLLGTGIYECATIKSAVRKRNAARLASRGLNFEAAPFLLPKGAGLQMRLSF